MHEHITANLSKESRGNGSADWTEQKQWILDMKPQQFRISSENFLFSGRLTHEST